MREGTSQTTSSSARLSSTYRKITRHSPSCQFARRELVRARRRRGREDKDKGKETYLLVDREEGEASDCQSAPEARRDVSGAGAAATLVDHERDYPAADRDLDADVREQEERHEVDGAEAEYLLVLVDTFEGIFGLLVRGFSGFLEAFYDHAMV